LDFPDIGEKKAVNGKGRLPVRSGSSSSLEVTDGLRQQVMDLKAHNRHLQNTLKATEATVHSQTHKMKSYRSMLIEHGLLPRSRSQSLDIITRRRSSSSSPLDAGKHLGNTCLKQSD